MEPESERPLEAGRVTRLVAQARHADRVSVYLDGRFAFGLHQDVVVAFGLSVGRHLEVPEQEAMLAAERRRAARARALALVAQRPRTTVEVRRALARRGFDADDAEAALDDLRRWGYLDDAAYAADFVRARFDHRGYGPGRLRAELLRRGVDRALVEAALAPLVAADDTVLEAARAHAARRRAALEREPDPLRRRRKLTDFLLRRGFDFDTVARVVEETLRAMK